MKTTLRFIVGIGTAVLLAGCGGGSAEVQIAPLPPQFVSWFGSAVATQVIDDLGHTFAFYSDNGCLYNFQTGAENSAFCLVPGTRNIVAYGPFRGEVVNVLASNGTCQAAIIDQLTGTFVDIEVDSYGREVVTTTPLHPTVCN
ncbi:MAG TPA: hypothetical protein VFS95_05460 [Telluria sp.]|nr:hypothetical protein [Telluria sp.]